jgi:hypothetical protein
MTLLRRWFRLFSRGQSFGARSLTTTCVFAALLLCCVGSAYAQAGQAAGIQMFSTRKFNIDLASSSMTTSFPIRTKAGKIPVSYSVAGNYQISPLNSSQLTFTNSIAGQPSAHVLGYAAAYTTTPVVNCNGSNEQGFGGWVIYDTTGASHSLGTFSTDRGGTCFPFPSAVTTTDGSGLTATNGSHTSDSPQYIYDSGGYSVSAGTLGTLTDPDGVTISETASSTINIIDSLGATFLSIPLIGNPFNAVSYTDASNDSRSYTIAYQSFNIKSNFNCSGLGYKYADYSVSGMSLPVSIADPTGAVTKFGYESTPGYSGYTTGRLASITYGSGGSISYAYSQNGDSQGQNGLDCVSFVVPMITVTVNDNNGNSSKWTYANYDRSSSTGNFTLTETDPAGNQTPYNFYSEYATQSSTYQGGCPTSVKGCNGGGTLLRTVTTCYNANFSSCAAPAYVTLPIYQTDVYTSLNGSSSNLVETRIDLTYGNVLEVKQYDFGAAMPPTSQTPLSDTLTYYGQSWNSSAGACNAYTSGYIFNTPCYSYTKNSAGTTVAQTQITYSNTGHPTTVKKWTSGTSWLTSTATYNSNGTVETSTDPSGAVSTYAYTGTGGCNDVLPTSITVKGSGVPAAGLSTSAQWNCNGGVVTQTADANSQPTNYSYNDPLWRQTEVSYPDGGSIATTYNTGSTHP